MTKEIPKCNNKTEVWARCVGYFRPISEMNKGKRAEIKDRKMYNIKKAT